MSFTRRLKSESGHAETFYLLFVLGIIAAIVVPSTLRWAEEVRNRRCLLALASAANQELDMGEASCSVSNMNVERETTEGVERYFLSGSEGRFPTSPVFLRSEGNLAFEQNFPRDEVEPDGKGRLKLGANRVHVENIREKILIKTEYTPWGFFLTILVGLVFVLLIWGAVEWGGGCLLTLIFFVPALLFLVADLITSESILIDPAENQVRVQTTYLGLLEFEPNVLTDPVALIPDGYQRANIMLLYRSEGRLRASYLFELDYDQLGGLAAAEDALRGSKPGDPTVVEAAPQGAGGEEVLPVESAPEDGKESWWSVLFRMLGKALPHLGRALLHLVVLVIGSLLIFFLAAGIAGLESFSLPFDQVFIITVLGTGLSPFFGWTSTGILLAIYAVWCMGLALYERFE